MRTDLLRSSVLALALLGAPVVALSQDASHTPKAPHPGPNATPPAADAHSTNAGTPVQPVPGAMPGSDTVPSTMSEQHAADDKLIILAYTFKNLSDEERRAIFAGLKGSAGQAFNADIGTQLPLSIGLKPVPPEIVAKVPQTAGYQYTVANNRVLLVSPPNRIVAGVFQQAEPPTTGQGRRPQ